MADHSDSDDEEFFQQADFFELKGRRSTMEDAHIVNDCLTEPVSDSGLYAVFDGHGGQKTAKYVAEKFEEKFVAHEGVVDSAALDVPKAFTEVFASLDKEVIDLMVKEGWADGSTGAVCFLDPRTRSIHTANIGDSEAFVIKVDADGKVSTKLLSYKHKPSNPDEKARIEAAGGHVVFGRILGNLAVARAFGDKDFKVPYNKSKGDFVSNEPFTSEHVIEEDDEILVVACDGMFEKLDYQQVAECIWERKKAGEAPRDGAEAAVKKSFESGSLDNISCVVVYLKPTPSS